MLQLIKLLFTESQEKKLIVILFKLDQSVKFYLALI